MVIGVADAGAQTPSSDVGKTVTLGIEARWFPRWEGSDRFVVLPIPLFDIRPAGTPERFRGARDGRGFGLVDTGRFRFGPIAKITVPRKEAIDPALRGLGDIGWAFELGAFADIWWLSWLRTRAELRQGFGGHHGIVADLMADAVVPVTPKLTLSGGPRITFASGSATSPYFSITATQAAASGLPMFDARGGLRSFGVGTQAHYAWTPRWSSYIVVEYERLAGDAKNSPLIVQRGSAGQWMFGAGVSYSFDVRF